MILYLLTYSFIIEFLLNIYLKDKEKEISIKKIHGYSYFSLYKDIYIFDLLTFLIPILFFIRLKALQILFIYFLLIFIFDFLFIFMKTCFKTYNIYLLKEV